MELDDLRRQWQQPVPADAPASLAPPDLARLLKRRSGGLVEKMQRNARLELGYNVLVMLALPFVYVRLHNPLFRAEAVLMLLLAGGLLIYYYQKLKMLRRMLLLEGNVRENLGQLCSGLRHMLRFYYRLTLASAPVALLFIFGFYVGQELARPGPMRAWHLLSMGAGMTVGCLLVQVPIVFGTRWYLQRLYGQHLDRLEANLQELTEEPVVSR